METDQKPVLWHSSCQEEIQKLEKVNSDLALMLSSCDVLYRVLCWLSLPHVALTNFIASEQRMPLNLLEWVGGRHDCSTETPPDHSMIASFLT